MSTTAAAADQKGSRKEMIGTRLYFALRLSYLFPKKVLQFLLELFSPTVPKRVTMWRRAPSQLLLLFFLPFFLFFLENDRWLRSIALCSFRPLCFCCCLRHCFACLSSFFFRVYDNRSVSQAAALLLFFSAPTPFSSPSTSSVRFVCINVHSVMHTFWPGSRRPRRSWPTQKIPRGKIKKGKGFLHLDSRWTVPFND